MINEANEFYEDGKFKPLSSSHGNISAEVAHLRNTYLEAEEDYFKMLYTCNKKLFDDLLTYPSDLLYEEAKKHIDAIEYGEVEEKDLENEEGMIAFCLAAIRDRVRILELVKTMDIEEEENMSFGRGR